MRSKWTTRSYGPPWPRGPWPDLVQGWLLRACLMEDDREALAAWDAWRRLVTLDELDQASNRLLPLLHHRLARTARIDPDADRIQGVARYYWARQVRSEHQLGVILATLSAAGIETLLLKGAALNLAVFPTGVRPMSDFDVAVPLPEAQRALQVLRDAGWRASFAHPERLVGVVHACQFGAAASPPLDLHWNFFHTRRLTAQEQRCFWEQAIQVRVRSQTTRILSPTHQLLHTCTHGSMAADTPPLRWLADATWIVRKHADAIDWDQLVGLVRRYELALPVEATLRCIAAQFGAPVPKTTLAEFRTVRTSPSARIENALAVRRFPSVDPFWSSLPYHLVGYWRQRFREPRLPLFEYLQLMHQLDGPLRRHLPRLRNVFATKLRQAVRSWMRALGDRCRRRSAVFELPVDTAERWRLVKFHELEVCGRQLFRWSGADANVLLPALAPGHYRLVVTLAPVRDWHSDLRRHLTFSFNGHDISAKDVEFSNFTLAFAVAPAMFAPGNRQRLWIRGRPLPTAGRDGRYLGVPVVSIRMDHAELRPVGRAA